MDGTNIAGIKNHAVKRASLADVPFLVALAQECYPERDLSDAPRWASNLISSPQGAIFFCGLTCVTAGWQIEFWEKNSGQRVAEILPAFSIAESGNPWALMKCYSAAFEWAKEAGCYGVRFGSTEGARTSGRRDRGFDVFASIAKRLGARPHGVTYIKEL